MDRIIKGGRNRPSCRITRYHGLDLPSGWLIVLISVRVLLSLSPLILFPELVVISRRIS